jgi:UV DNA damage endonuclease
MPVCAELNIPLVYDVHHHRCNPDGLSIAEATEQCLDSWQRSDRGEAYLHLSSPREGWAAENPKPHSDMIDFDDFPQPWLDLNATIDIEAKAKEEAVLEIMKYVSGR